MIDPKEFVITDPMVGFYLWDDGEVVFEFQGQTGGKQSYSFTDIERMRDLSAAFAMAADEAESGDWSTIIDNHGVYTSDEVLTTEDLL